MKNNTKAFKISAILDYIASVCFFVASSISVHDSERMIVLMFAGAVTLTTGTIMMRKYNQIMENTNQDDISR